VRAAVRKEYPDLQRQLGAVDSVLICGMGGSAIGGEFAAAWASAFDVAVRVHRGYGLPAGVRPKTLVVFSSYSGNTEETLSAFDKRLVLRCDRATQRKERHRREHKLQRLAERLAERNAFVAQSSRAKPEAGLRALQRWAKQHKLSAFVELSLNERTIELRIDEEAKLEAALLDGCYCIESDVPVEHLNTQDVHDRYKDLQDVERNFRRLKTACLEVRPIFVRKEQRTRGHVFIAMLALKVLRLMEQRLGSSLGTTETNPKAETTDSALAALSRLSLQHYTLGQQDIVGLPRPDARQRQILDALGVTLIAPQ
jgi:transposase